MSLPVSGGPGTRTGGPLKLVSRVGVMVASCDSSVASCDSSVVSCDSSVVDIVVMVSDGTYTQK